MRTVSCILCESANTLKDGRFNLLGGGIHVINSKNYPVNINLGIVLIFEFLLTEEGTHKLEIRFISVDGKNIVPPQTMDFSVPKGTHFTNFVINLGNIKIPLQGEYSFEVFLDGLHQQAWPLQAK